MRPAQSQISLSLTLMAITLMLGSSAWAQSSYQILYNFSPGQHLHEGDPIAPLIFDGAGNLYGTAGDVFKLSPDAGGTWTETVLALAPGVWSAGKLTFDKAGNLYGTGGGGLMLCNHNEYECGTVFQLMPNSDGTWTEHILYNFTGSGDGAFPYGGLVMDNSGNLYGTASEGSSKCKIKYTQCGVVFELTPNGDGTWTYHVLHSFTGPDGVQPYGTLIFHRGSLYGTTTSNVFSLKRNPDGTWKETVLYTFQGGNDGGGSWAGVVFDHAGNLYGTTAYGGGSGCYNNQGCGTVFQLTPNPDGTWTEHVIYRFLGGTDGANPYYAGVVLDAAGNLYGTTVFGGDNSGCIGGDCGTVFELTPGVNGQWTETVLHRFFAFNGSDGKNPVAGLVLGKAHHFYGTASFGGSTDAGVVFEITP